jgi:hypothetical protein
MDWAWDLKCPEDFQADDFARAVRSGSDYRKFTHRVAAENGVSTHYLGGKKSPLFVRIYRKDLQDLFYRGDPTLRLELVSRDAPCRHTWERWVESEALGFGLAAAYVNRITGYELPGVVGVPSEPTPWRDAAVRVYRLLQAYAGVIGALDEVGIDIVRLAKMWPLSRMSQWRKADLVREMGMVGADQVVAAVVDLMGYDRAKVGSLN